MTMRMARHAASASFAGVPAGTYRYYCMPHLALGMKAALTVE